MTDSFHISRVDPEASQPKDGATSWGYLGGKKPLWKAFWLVYVLGNGALLLLGSAAFGGAFAVSVTPSTGILFNPIQVAFLVALVQGFYFVFSSIVVWRCSPNTTIQGLRNGMRVFVLLDFAWWMWRFFVFALFAVPRLYG